MADDTLGEHPDLSSKVSISSSEAVGSQGTSRSSLVSSTISSSVSDGGLAVSRCSKSGVDWVSSSSSWLDMKAEGVSSDGCQVSSRCSKGGVDQDFSRPSLPGIAVEGVSSVSLKMVDCKADGNKGHTRSNVKCPYTEESAQRSRLTSEGGSIAASTIKEKVSLGELATDIAKVEVGGSNTAATTEEKAP
eukprot:15068553-Ditylum_brightwellii.AAC.1